MEKDQQKRLDIISFMGPVNDSNVGRLIDLAYTADAEGSSEIHLFISSTGGKVNPGFTAYEFFRSLRLPFHTYNVGTLEPPAVLLYLSAERRCASPNSKFLFYNFEWTFYRDHIRYPEIIEAYESLRFDVERYTTVFNERTGGAFNIKHCLEGPSQVLDAWKALDAGIVTEAKIIRPEIPELAKLWSIH